MTLTANNYFDLDAQMRYTSASQFKRFAQCEAAALAEITGEYEPPKSTALLVGSYVDAYFEGTLGVFRAQHPELFVKSGDLKAEYRKADEIIARIEQDEMMMRYLSGQKQVIQTGEIEGIPFKTKIDSYHPGKAIVDLKIMRDFEPVWKPGQGKVNFAEGWGYDIQGAIYQAVEGNALPFILAAATKETEPDIALIAIPQYKLDAALAIVKALSPRYADIKRGIIPPTRCERCDYCKRTKILNRVIDLDEMEEA